MSTLTAIPEKLDTAPLSKEAGRNTTGSSRLMNPTCNDQNAVSTRCAIYTRFSCRNSRDSSIEDQERQCRAGAQTKGWTVLDQYVRADEGKSGTTLEGRYGLQELVALAKTKPRPFDYILCDSTDRFGRSLANVTSLLDILTHHGVYLYFVTDHLDSADPYFRQVFAFKAQMDESFSKGLSDKVRRGKTGRFLNGYHPGGKCYGYRNVPVEDPSRGGVHGHNFVIGCIQTKYDPEAAIVERIFNDYVSGISMAGIAKKLNAEGVPSPQGPRSRRVASWSKGAIDTILNNERYIGRTFWNHEYQVRNPETGMMESRTRPESEWEFYEKPELRIVTDELYKKAQEQCRRVTRGNIPRLGGETRTDASRKYIFSGLLKCGLCGANMTITGTQPARYGCPSYRHRGTCANSVTILRDALEAGLISALGEKVGSPEVRESIVAGMMDQLRKVQEESNSRAATFLARRAQFEEERMKLRRTVENLCQAIGDLGGSSALNSKLQLAECRLAQLDDELSGATKAPEVKFSRRDIGKFVEEKADRFGNVLLGDPETAKNEMRKLVTKITLTPSEDERGVIYVLSGDVGLFSVGERVVLQSDSLESIRLQYKFSFSLSLVPYVGKRLFPQLLKKAA